MQAQNRLSDGWSKKSANNCNAQYSELGRRSYTPDHHRNPDRAISCNVGLSPNQLSDGSSRNRAISCNVGLSPKSIKWWAIQEKCNKCWCTWPIGELGRWPHTPDQHRSPDVTPKSRLE